MKYVNIIINILIFQIALNTAFVHSQQPNKRSFSPSNYVKGEIDYNDLSKNQDLTIDIYYIETSNFPNELKLHCVVKDKFGNLVFNLAPPFNHDNQKYWSIKEIYDNRIFEIEDFKVTEIRDNELKNFATAFVLDYSGSMENDFQFVDDALHFSRKFFLNEENEYSIIQFDHRVYQPVNLTNDINEFSKKMNFYDLAGYTAFYDAAYKGIDEVANSKKQRIAIMFTDGGDNSSKIEPLKLIKRARETNTRIFVIGFDKTFGNYLTNSLEIIANQTGGKAFFPKKISEIKEIFDEIFNILRVHYIVEYDSDKSIDNVHQVNLKFDNPNDSITAHGNKAYYIEPEEVKVFKFRIGLYGQYGMIDEKVQFSNFSRIPNCYRNLFEVCDNFDFDLSNARSYSLGALIEIPSLITTPFGIGFRGGINYTPLDFVKTEYAFENTALQRDMLNEAHIDLFSFNVSPYLIFTFVDNLNLYVGVNWTFNIFSNDKYTESIVQSRIKEEIANTIYENNSNFYEYSYQVLGGLIGLGYEFVLNEDRNFRISPEVFYFHNVISSNKEFDNYLNKITFGLSFKWGY